MKPELNIIGPCGIGDTLILNGLIRHFATTHRVSILAHHNYIENTKYIFRDLDDITIRNVPFDELVKNKDNPNNLLLGHYKMMPNGCDTYYSNKSNWVKDLYRDAKLDPRMMFDNFKFVRDYEREEAFYKRVVEYLGTDKYIVVADHQDSSPDRGELIKSKIPENYPIYYCKMTEKCMSNCVFDYCTVIERAQAYHGFDCGFTWIVELCNLKVPKRYIHTYSNRQEAYPEKYPKGYYRGDWIVVHEKSDPDLIDRLSILEIKKERIEDPEKLKYIEKEYEKFAKLTHERSLELKNVNTILWNVENEIRKKERDQCFDSEFIRLARLVYIWNDKRHEFKNKIANGEQKSHVSYTTKKPELLVIIPPGFGDSVVCNGLVREFAKTRDVILGLHQINMFNVPYMFRDLTNIQYVIAYQDCSEQELAQIGKNSTCETLCLSYMKEPHLCFYLPYRKNWVREMYEDAKLDPNLMFDNFYVLRDQEREEQFYQKVIKYLGTTDYVTVQDCSKRGEINRTKIPENCKVFSVSKGFEQIESDCIFDYRLVVERSQAYHGYDSGFSWVVELCKYNVPKKYLHDSNRVDHETFPHGYYRTDWIVLR
jgi:Family of unknown function (DUF6165)